MQSFRLTEFSKVTKLTGLGNYKIRWHCKRRNYISDIAETNKIPVKYIGVGEEIR
ncbi:MAG: hypothetical protein MZV64_45065 [Ignavibacteriales bacterium]|nr:hypothetical protein [Ignavibacteriales bacterium]